MGVPTPVDISYKVGPSYKKIAIATVPEQIYGLGLGKVYGTVEVELKVNEWIENNPEIFSQQLPEGLRIKGGEVFYKQKLTGNDPVQWKEQAESFKKIVAATPESGFYCVGKPTVDFTVEVAVII